MRSVVFCVGGCLSVLLGASVAAAADADSDLMSNQPWCGWDDVIFVHSILKGGDSRAIQSLPAGEGYHWEEKGHRVVLLGW